MLLQIIPRMSVEAISYLKTINTFYFSLGSPISRLLVSDDVCRRRNLRKPLTGHWSML